MHLTCIMLRIINLVAVVLMMFFESNLKIEHFTEKIEIFTEILFKNFKNFKNFQRRGGGGGGGLAPRAPPPPPPPPPPTRRVGSHN